MEESQIWGENGANKNNRTTMGKACNGAAQKSTDDYINYIV